MLYASDGKTPETKMFPIEGIPLTLEEQRIMEAFIQGSVLTIVTAREDEPFFISLLFGGKNDNWAGTPLQPLFNKHVSAGETESDAFDNAAMNAGALLRNVLIKYEGKTFKKDDTYKAEHKIRSTVYRYVK